MEPPEGFHDYGSFRNYDEPNGICYSEKFEVMSKANAVSCIVPPFPAWTTSRIIWEMVLLGWKFSFAVVGRFSSAIDNLSGQFFWRGVG